MIKNNEMITKITNMLLNILIVIFGIILVVSAYNIVQLKVFKNDYSNFFGYTMFEVQTGSMEPTIKAGDWIIVKLTNEVDLDDIITYRHNEEFFTHRVKEKYNNNLVTQGDANPLKDQPIEKEQIVGKLVKTLGPLGLIRNVIFNPFVIIALFITIYLFSNVLKKRTPKKKVATKQLIEYETEEEAKALNQKLYEEIKEQIYIVDQPEEELVEEKPGEEIMPEEVEEQPKEEVLTDEELSKTSVFRIISVDEDEISSTLETLSNVPGDDLITKPKKELVKEEKVEETLTDIKLDLLEDKDQVKTGKNIFETFLNIKREELNTLAEILTTYETDFVVRNAIRNSFVDTYLNSRYNNAFIDNVSTTRKSIIKIRESLVLFNESLIKEYKGPDKKYSEYSNAYLKLFTTIANLEHDNDIATTKGALNQLYMRDISKYGGKSWTKNKINHLIKHIHQTTSHFEEQREEFLNTFASTTFVLNQDNFTGKKDYITVKLNHKVAFSKVYSDYIIDKTYAQGAIAEDKIPIMLSQLSVLLIHDMVSASFSKKYFFMLPETLFTKSKKIERTLRFLDNKYAQEHTCIVVTSSIVNNNKTVISSLHKLGYDFALLVDETKVNKKEMYLMDYFIASKKMTKKRALELVPGELHKQIIYDDILLKITDEESE